MSQIRHRACIKTAKKKKTLSTAFSCVIHIAIRKKGGHKLIALRGRKKSGITEQTERLKKDIFARRDSLGTLGKREIYRDRFQKFMDGFYNMIVRSGKLKEIKTPRRKTGRILYKYPTKNLFSLAAEQLLKHKRAFCVFAKALIQCTDVYSGWIFFRQREWVERFTVSLPLVCGSCRRVRQSRLEVLSSPVGLHL